jgi:hypothetical protein
LVEGEVVAQVRFVVGLLLDVAQHQLAHLSQLLLRYHASDPAGDCAFQRGADLHLLAMSGGRERTRRQFEQLFSRAGLRLERVEPAPALPQLLVAVPA